jgi:glutamate racemase
MRPIGLFDSGSGGLTVLKQILTYLPRESTLTFADTAHLPYGGRARSELEDLAKEGIALLVSEQVKLIVIACHTLSSLDFETLQKGCPVPLVGMAGASCRAVRKIPRLALLATEATIRSNLYPPLLTGQSVFPLACPAFVPHLEFGTPLEIEKELEPLRSIPLDGALLACTHFPMLKEEIGRVLSMPLIDPADEVAKEVAAKLTLLHLHAQNGPVSHRYITSGPDDTFSYFLDRLRISCRKQELMK